ASSLTGPRRRNRLGNDSKLNVLLTLDRSSLDTVQGVMPDYREIISGDKMDGVCLRDVWAVTIELNPPSGGYRVTAYMPPVNRFPLCLPPTPADLQQASHRADITVPLTAPLAELTVRLVGLLKNSRVTMWVEFRDVFISQQFLDAIRPALKG
ncbi:hypothetical protein AAVH_33203, partial [Aphelenchoides avenae]